MGSRNEHVGATMFLNSPKLVDSSSFSMDSIEQEEELSKVKLGSYLCKLYTIYII